MKGLKISSILTVRTIFIMLCLAATAPQLRADVIVAGNNSSLFGDSWSTGTNSSNQMSQVTGTSYYYLTKSDVSLTGDLQFKVVDNGSWYGAGSGGSGGNISVTASGTHTLTFLYNSSSHEVDCIGTHSTDVIVTGSDSQALGSSWGNSDLSNAMTTSDGITFTLTRTATYASGGSMQFKVHSVGNDRWYGTSSGGNVYYSIPQAGEYEVTYSFNVITREVTATPTPVQVEPVTPTYYITGDNGLGLGGFSFAPTIAMTYDEANEIYTYTYQVTAAGTYYFAFADGQGTSWDDFNGNYRIGPTSGNANVNLNGGWATTQKGSGAYAVTVAEGLVTISFDVTDAANMKYRVDGTAPSAVVTYYVKGDDTAIFPNGWNAGDGTAMTDNEDGTYSWTSAQFHLTSGTSYAYKVWGDDNSWHPSGENATFGENVPGTYTVTITYDSNNETVTHQLNLIQADARIYSVRGSKELVGGDDDWSNAQALTDDGDGTYSWQSGELMLTAGTYFFKVNDNYGNWYGDAGSDNGNNIEVTVPASGTYTLHIDFDGTGAPTYQLERVDLSTIYITGSAELGLGWTPMPTTTLDYDVTTGLYSYTCQVNDAGTYGFVFATGQGSNADDWSTFNGSYRVGPTSGDETVTLGGDWASTQVAGGDHGSYQVTVGVGTYTIYFDPNNMKYRVAGAQPIYITGDLGLGLGWSYAPANAMTYNDTTGLYSYTYRIPKQGTYNFVFATGQANVDNDRDGWNTFNYHYRVGPTGDSEEYTVGTDEWKGTQMARIGEDVEAHAYYAKLPAGDVTIYFDYDQMQFMIESDGVLGQDLYMVGGITCDSVVHSYAPNDGVLMKYDNNKKLYYLNHVALNTNSTFCFTTALGNNWESVGTRYGNADTDTLYYREGDNDDVAYLMVNDDKINVNMPLGEWNDTLGEWKMFTAGIYNVVVNLESGWVKLVKTDQFSLFPMNVYLQQTPNVKIDNVGTPGQTYTTDDFDGYWPLVAYNRLMGNWDPQSDATHYSVKYVGDTTTSDGKMWWHWQVSASIAEVIFTRTNATPAQSEVIARKAGVLWYTWEDDNTMTAHSREYFTSSATQLPGNVVVEEGHFYVYFINTVGWETVYCVAWSDSVSPYVDGHGKNVEQWPGQPMRCIGIDPMTGYEVWEYDFGTIEGSIEPDDLLFHDGTPIATTDAKEQTGDFGYINGGVYDYLGVFDDAFTLNNLIRSAKMNVRYTISNDLLGVYYDKDAVTPVTYQDNNGTEVSTTVRGALYAKDMNEYGEKSINPDETVYTDYVYDICKTTGNDNTRPSQIMDKRDDYDQSNWIKLVISPNYDGGTATPTTDVPNLKDYEGHIIPAKSLQLYMTDSINPTARVMAISLGDAMDYEPNVYVSAHFNDTIVFNYTHRDWQPHPYAGSYRTKPIVSWDSENNSLTVKREKVEEDPYKMFYVAPKPQEIAYITWVVYDNDNTNNEWPYYTPGVYTPYTYPNVSSTPPSDPGRFYAPRNWDRSVTIPLDYLKQVLDEEQLELLYDGYLSEDQLNDIAGGYGQQYGPYSNGYMQCGAVKVNWSLFDFECEACEGQPWWRIFKPGQAYKFKAIIRYARGSGDVMSGDNECYAPSSGEGHASAVQGAPRRADASSQEYANMYFTSNYSREGLDHSKFIIFPLEASPSGSNGSDMGNVTTVREIATSRTATGVRYYNLMGVESDKPFDGINIVVTTYSDGSRSSRKILR